MAKMKKNKKKNNEPIGKGEYLFNIISYLLIIALAVYIGYRSIYYYSKQHIKEKKEEKTLAATIIKNNKTTTKNDGFHQTKENYYFTGQVNNNYVKIFNRLYRVIEINKNKEVKIVSNDNEATFIYGDTNEYSTSNIYTWLNKTDNEKSGIYYNTIPGVEKLLTKTEYCEATLNDKNVECITDSKKDYFTILTLNDYVKALGKNSYLNINKNSFILGYDQDKNPLITEQSGNIVSANSYEGNGIRVVMTLKKNIKIIQGTGTLEDPYVIDQENHENSINKYVKLDNDIYQIYEENNNDIRLRLNDYVKVNNNYYESYYSKNKEAIYNLKNKNNIAYYLNNKFYNSLSYKDLLKDCTFYTGTTTSTESLNYEQIYKQSITAKIGLPNVYDINLNKDLTDYYYINTTSEKSSLALVYDNIGFIKEEETKEIKKVVPVICMDKQVLTQGTGTIDDPYRIQ